MTSAQSPDAARYLPQSGEVTVFSAPWCGYCTRLKQDMDRAGIAYTEVDIDQDPEAAKIAAAANGGDWIIPTVLLADGQALVNPGVLKLQQALAEIA